MLQNARDLNIDLSDVKDAILTHNHWDHVGGLMPLRREMMKKKGGAVPSACQPRNFYSRPSPKGEQNEMIGIRKDYETSGGKCIEHAEGFDIFPGAWLTGPVPRKYPERNWSPGGKLQTPSGLVEDNIPEDQSLVLNTSQGLVVLTGCGHAGIINILTYAKQRFPNQPVYGVVGGLHLFAATDEQLNWTGDKLKDFRVAYLLGAHCTGIEAVYRLRERTGLTRQSAVVGSVGSMFTLGEEIRPGMLPSKLCSNIAGLQKLRPAGAYDRRFKLRNAVGFSSAYPTKRFPWSRCVSAIQIVRPLESIADRNRAGSRLLFPRRAFGSADHSGADRRQQVGHHCLLLPPPSLF